VAALRVEAAAAAAGVPIAWEPFLLGPIFKRQGWEDSPFNLFPARGRYMWRDLERLCARHGLPFRRPGRFPKNPLLAARVACLGESEPWLPEFSRAVFRANFADDLDIAAPGVLADILVALGLDAADLLRRAGDAAAKERLRERTDRAWGLGIFGAPTFVVDGEIFWGNDRMDEAFAWRLQGPPAGLSGPAAGGA
jgi:2-hydroxychromene-2-carboxylate isomerase